MALTIALLGAQRTGKTTLALAMGGVLRASGHQVEVVPEMLRTWCEREQRAPRADEQLPIAQAQEAKVDAATARADIVIADTSALIVAVHGGMLSMDGPLYRFALQRQRGYDLALVTGLDLPRVAHGMQQAQGWVDARVRQALDQASVGYSVVYGSGDERTRNALAPVQALLGERPPQASERLRWSWSCDKCSDPACEHRLFTGLRDR
ncbi:MAG: hypothetical protein NVS2B4_02130 [Ramlibacter sp.]